MTATTTAPPLTTSRATGTGARPFRDAAGLVRHPAPLRVLPVPETEPPVEHGALVPVFPVDPGQGVLALLPGDNDPEVDGLFGPRSTPSRELPDPTTWGRRIAQLIVEVLVGQRPSTQLVRWTSEDVYRRVRRRIRPVPRPGDRGRAASASAEPRLRHVVGGVRVSEPTDGVAEVAAIIHGPHRVQALALRLEGRDGRWVVTVLQSG